MTPSAEPGIYLDYAATTPVDPRVAAAMGDCLTLEGCFGNPASTGHAYGWRAKRRVETAREQVAALLGADSREIVWTSGATEANNLALQGAAMAVAAGQWTGNRGRHIVTCKTEHKAVLDVCKRLEHRGFSVAYLEPEGNGLLDLESLAQALREDTVLVSIMHVNNEIGVIQDIAAIGELTRSRGALLHVDAAQSAGKIPIDLAQLPVDLMSVCAHKIYGPKGVGALYVRRRPKVRLQALIHGGGQERGLRAGTLPTHQIVGMGEAFRLAREAMAADNERLAGLRDRLWQAIRRMQGIRLNGVLEKQVANILNVSFQGIDAEALLMDLDGIALSSGSACTSATQEPSHVLRALGLSDEQAHGSIRFSWGRFTTPQEIDTVAERLQRAVARLRELSPLWGETHAC